MQDTELDSSWLESGQRTYYGRIPNWIVRNPNISDAAVRLYAYLDSRLSRGVSETFPSNKTIAADLGKGVTTIKRLKAELAAAGCIETVERKRPDGSQTSNIIVLRFEDASKNGLEGSKNGPGEGSNYGLPRINSPKESEITSTKRARGSGNHPSSREEALAYAGEIGLPPKECDLFLAHFEGRGWEFKGGAAVKCWKGAMRTWLGNLEKGTFEPKKGYTPQRNQSAREIWDSLGGGS